MQKLLYLLAIMCLSTPLRAQKKENLFDIPHSIRYAGHLYMSRQYTWAAEEYERLLDSMPANDTLQYKVLNCYRLAPQLTMGLKRGEQLYAGNPWFAARPAAEYARLLLLADSGGKAINYLRTNHSIDTTLKSKYLFYSYMLNGDWQAANAMLPGIKEQLSSRNLRAYDSLLRRAEKLHRKSPFIAGTLSAVLPGLGKVYAGNAKDGFYSFATVAVLAYSTWHGFSVRGERSVYGWISGGLAVGFYAGNIYGSVKEARKYLPWHIHRIKQSAKSHIYTDL